MAFQRFDPISKYYLKKALYGVAIVAGSIILYKTAKQIKESNILDCMRSAMPTSKVQETFKPSNSLVSTYKL